MRHRHFHPEIPISPLIFPAVIQCGFAGTDERSSADHAAISSNPLAEREKTATLRPFAGLTEPCPPLSGSIRL